MDSLKMHTPNLADENYRKLAELFPNAVTETITGYDEEGKPIVERAIDKDVLMQEISTHVVEGREERYQFTWPDKKKAILAANAPISATLRPVKEESVGKDGTPGGWDSQNLYIEGDNQDVLKLLQETYLGKVKLIYIDPPYNTGNDFVYEDDFVENMENYLARSGQFDEFGNRLEQNTVSNGRFHTDWLNMIYTRIKLSKNLLTEDGLIFISIDDHELFNLKKVCDEIFGENNCLTCITRATGTPTGGGFDGLVNELDYLLVYARNKEKCKINGLPMDEESAKIYDQRDEYGKYLIRPLRRTGGEDRREDRPTMFFPIVAPDGSEVYPIGPTGYESRWICSSDTVKKMEKEHLIAWKKVNKNGVSVWQVYQKFYLENRTKTPGNLWDDVEGNKKATRDIRELFNGDKVFDFPKPVGLLMKAILIGSDKESIILDFFSGSSTTAHAVIKQNVEDGGRRRFIMVQIPEICTESTEAYKAGYKNICEIGKERIRRTGKQIKDEVGMIAGELDIGFRVLRLDSSNMEDVYYNPTELSRDLLGRTVDNIKIDRTPEDLLFQVMLDLGVDLSSSIDERMIGGKKVFIVKPDGIDMEYLVACFDSDVTDATVTEIAKMKPYYAVFRDNGMTNDSVATNFEQIFKTYSPQTERKVL